MPKENGYQRVKSAVLRMVENSSLRGVALIGGGAAIGQILMVLSTPIVSRLYGPQAYGALAVFGSVLSIASILVTFRFEIAIPLPTEDEEARDLLVLALSLALLSAGLVFLALLLWPLITHSVNRDPLIRQLTWTLPVGMLGIGIYQSLAYWATRKRLYGAISATRVTQSVAGVGTQFALCRLPPLGIGLILASIVGQAFGLRSLLSAFLKSAPKEPLPSISRLAFLVRKYFDFSAYGIATAITTTIGGSLAPLLLAKVYSLEVAGIYLMASRVFSLPSQMIGGAVSQVFMGEASQRLRENPRSVLDYFNSIHRTLLWAGAGVLVLGGFSPFVLPWILGAKWQAAGMVAAILSPMSAMELTVTPFYNITVIGNHPKLQLFTGIFPMALSIIGLGIPAFLGFSYNITLISYVLSRCVACWVVFLVYRNIAKKIGLSAIQSKSIEAPPIEFS